MMSSLSYQSLQNRASALACLSGRCTDDVSASSNRLLQIPAMNQHQRSSSSLSQQHQQTSSDEAEELLMSEFNKLSVDDQAKALDDIYSAGSELKENPVMIDKLLTEFEQQVEQGNYPIYELALNQDRSYVEDPSFRLKFLRANLHDVNKAVKQMISYLYQKAKYFGADAVARDITLDDLTPSDLKFMLSGHYHIQDGTDRNGRVIFYILSSDPPKDMDSMIRVVYYIWSNIMIPIHSVQMKGIVSILYYVIKPGDEQTHPTGLGDMKRFSDFIKVLPLRTSAFHVCLTREEGIAPLRNAFIQLCLKVVPKSIRERARVHHGSPVELQYQLSTFGIPQDTIPVDMGGNLRRGILNAWFYKHLASEGGISRHFLANHHDDDDDSFSGAGEASESLTASSLAGGQAKGVDDGGDGDDVNSSSDDQENAIVPPPYSNQDVLLGRGHDVQNHPGNTAFRLFLKGYQDEYDNSPRLSKRSITKNLTRMLMADGVRFWQKSASAGNVWIETGFDEAEKKVGQVFRSVRKKMPRQY